MELNISNKDDLVHICRVLKLTADQIRRLMIQSSIDKISFDSAYVMSQMTRGEGGLRSFYDIPTQEILGLAQKMKSRVIEQDSAVDTVCDAIIRRKTNLQTREECVGTFLFAGPTGVGKTYFAKVLTDFLYLNKSAIIFVDLSQYKNRGDVSQLFGAPPGFVGHNDEGGWLTRRVKRIKCGVILFDEMEKADNEVLDVLLRIAAEGQFDDSSTQETISLSEFVVILTSNLGTKEAMNVSDPLQKKEIVIGEIKKHLKPELINRFDDVVVFHTLSPKACCKIADQLLKENLEQIKKDNIQFGYTDRLIEAIVKKGFDREMNARPLARKINELVMTPIAKLILRKDIRPSDKIRLDWENGELNATRLKA